MQPKQSIAEQVTASIIESLQANRIPWRRPWDEAGLSGHRNAITKKLYRGINRLTLSLASQKKGYPNPTWLTFRQALGLEGNVRKGEKAAHVFYWHFDELAKKNAAGEVTLKKRAWMKASAVFNVAQCDLPPDVVERLTAPPASFLELTDYARADRLATRMNDWCAAQSIRCLAGDRACYSSSDDTVTMPPESAFYTRGGYAVTLAHECAHATGHHSRLDRVKGSRFGSGDYAREELVAELASAFLAAQYGIDAEDITTNRNAYIQSWIKALQNDPNAIIVASGAAEKAYAMLAEPSAVPDPEPEPETESEPSTPTPTPTAPPIASVSDFPTLFA